MRSARSRQSRRPTSDQHQPEPNQGAATDPRPTPDTDGAGSGCLYGNDDASDVREDVQPPSLHYTSETPFTGNDSSDDSNNQVMTNEAQVHVPMPIVSTGLATFAFQRALINRIKEPLLKERAKYDIKNFTPTFIHDALMMPGSLANLLGKASPEDIVHRMTPGLLSGYHAHVHGETLQPCLVPSTNPNECIQGMLIFGQGKDARKYIHKHFRRHGKRKRIEVDIEVAALATNPDEGAFLEDRWHLKRRTVQAHAWVWPSPDDGGEEFLATENSAGWTLEDYLNGDLSWDQPQMRVEANAKGDEDEDGYIGREIKEYVIEPEKRETVYSGSGGLDYGRAQTFTGW